MWVIIACIKNGVRWYKIYIYVAGRQPICACACSVVRNVGGVKCGPLLKHSNHFKRTLKCFKMDPCAWLLFNIQSSDFGATNVAKVSLYSTFTRSTVSFGYV